MPGVPSQLNQSMQALSDFVADCLQATPVRVTYQASCCESSPEASKGAGRGVVNLLERVKTVFDRHSFPFLVKHGTAATDAAGRLRLSSVCLCASQHQQGGTSHARGTVSAGYSTTTPEAKLHPAGLALPRGDCLRGRNRWRVLGETPPAGPFPQVPPSPEAVSCLKENAPLRKAHDSTVTILVRQEFSCEL